MSWQAAAAGLGSGLEFLGGMMQMNQNAAQFGMQTALAREQMQRDNTRFWDQWNVDNWMADRNDNFQRESWGNAFNQALHMQGGDQGFAREMFGANAALQREFAQNGIQWKVDDARAAGLHPLFALGGGSSFSPAPISVGSTAPSLSASPSASSRGGAFSPTGLPSGGTGVNPFMGMGQNLARAVMATQSAEDRFKDELSAAQIRNLDSSTAANFAQAQYYASRPAVNNRQVGPPMPGSASAGGRMTGEIEVKPHENITSPPGAPSTASGSNPGTMIVDEPFSVRLAPSKAVQIDDVGSPGWTSHQVNTTILPMLGAKPDPALHAHLKARWPRALGYEFVPALGWVPKYADDVLTKAGTWLRRQSGAGGYGGTGFQAPVPRTERFGGPR